MTILISRSVNMSYNRFIELILRKKSARLTNEEQKELDELQENSPGYLEISGFVDQLYELPLKEVREINEDYLEDRWNSLKRRMKHDPASKANQPVQESLF